MALTFDDILIKYVGNFGWYQKKRLIILAIVCGFLSVHSSMSTVFIAAKPEFHCKPSVAFQGLNCSENDIREYTIPRNEDGKFSKCKIFSVNSSETDQSDSCPVNTTGLTVPKSSRKTESCTSWNYNHDLYESTVVTEWDLVCDNANQAANTAGFYMAARSIGTLLGGYVADRFGRKPTVIIAGVVEGGSFLASAFAPNYGTFVALRCVMGFFSLWLGCTVLVFVVEYVGPNRRSVVVAAFMLGWAIAYAITAGSAYLLNNWRKMSIAYGVYELVATAFCAWWLTESPRWLFSRNKFQQAWTFLNVAAETNNMEIPKLEDVDIAMIKSTSVGTSPVDLFKFPAIRYTTLNLIFLWFVATFVYYGISLNSSELGGSPYINFLISGLVEMPAYALAMVLPQMRFGRVVTFSGSYLASGIVMLLILAVPTNMDWPVIVLAMTGKFFNCIAFEIAFLYTPEVYCTPLRATALQTCSALSRVGSIIGAYVVLLAEVDRSLPLITYAVASILAGLLTLVLPETKGAPLTETVPECEDFIRRTKSIIRVCKDTRSKSQNEKTDTINHNVSSC